MRTPATAPRGTLACGTFALLLVLSGCDKWKAEQGARNDKTRETVTADYQRLGFMLPLLDEKQRETRSCDDDDLPKHLKKSARTCERLALTDEHYVRFLFGGESAKTATADPDWAWLRTLSFQKLGPLNDIKDGNPLSIHRTALETMARTNVGVFTDNEAPPSEAQQRYEGWLLIIDTAEEKLRCQVRISADVSKVFAPPSRKRGDSQYTEGRRSHIDAFHRDVDKQLRIITKNFCAN